MEFSVKSGSPEKQRSACIVVGVFEPRRLSPIAEQLDKISDEIPFTKDDTENLLKVAKTSLGSKM